MSVASPLEQAMLKLINAERLAVGVAALQFDETLNDAAEDHSSDMLVNNIFSHTGVDGSTARERMIEAGYVFEGTNASGENIAFQSERGDAGLLDDVQDIHDDLMDSPGHRANILSPNFDEIGIGIVEGSFATETGIFNAVMVTQNFAKTDAVDTPVVVTPDQPSDVDPTIVDPTAVDLTDIDLTGDVTSEEPLVTVGDDDDTEDFDQDDTTQDDTGQDDLALDLDQDEDLDEDLDTPIRPPQGDTEEDEQIEDPILPVLDGDPADDLDGDLSEPEDDDDTEFVFEGDGSDEDGTTDDGDDGAGYVWTKTHSDATYATIIEDFTVSCTAEAFAVLDQELQAFVLREFDCDFEIA